MARATVAEQDLTRIVVGEAPVRESGRRGRLRLRLGLLVLGLLRLPRSLQE